MEGQFTSSRDACPSSVAASRQILRRLVCRPGEAIFSEGDAADQSYEVLSGAVRACRLLPDGRRQILEFYLPGDLFGHDGLHRRHSFSAEVAAIDGTVLVQHRQPVPHTNVADPESCRLRLCDHALRSLERTHGRLLILGRLEAPERLAALLLEMELRLRGPQPMRDVGHFTLPMSRRDAADYLGIPPKR